LNTQNHLHGGVFFRPVLVPLLCVAALAAPAAGFGQTVALLRGVVSDRQGGVMPGAEIRLVKPLTGLERTSATSPNGAFEITNIPLDTYELRVTLDGFAPYAQTVDLRTSVPVDLAIVLELAVQSSITVTPDHPPIDTVSAGTRNQVSATQIEQLPAAIGSRGLEAVLVTFPGFAQNANGAIHPRGAHNQMTFVIDGLAISDQLTGAFANALDAGVVQNVELMTGNIPAEFGSKVSGVAVITSRSGYGLNRRMAGDVMMSAAGFDTWHGAAQVGGGRGRVGYFASGSGMRTDRFLDQVSIDNLHNAGHFSRGFGRIDVHASGRDTLRFHVMGGRSHFEIANLRSQALAGQDQQQTLSDAAGWVSYLRTLDVRSTLEATVGYRATSATLGGSPGDTPVTASQRRRLATLTASARYTRVLRRHTFRSGVDLQRFPVRETFVMGLTSPAFNAPDSAHFNASLLPFDLSRGGAPFVFHDAKVGRMMSAFGQSSLRWGALTAALGVRYDDYRFLVNGRQLQPRLGIAYALPGGVIRASYNRNYQTPPNENLLLSSSVAASQLAPQSVTQALGGSYRPIRPERQNVFEVGFQRPVRTLAIVDLSVYRKTSRDQQDNNNFFDTGIIFPTALAAIRVEGADLRVTFPRQYGVSGTASATVGRAISTPPFTGGLFLGQDAIDVLSSGPFRIDHDQVLSVHSTVQYTAPRGVWMSASVRYDSGLVSNPSDPAEVLADPDFADLLPYVDLTSSPPRVRPRTIVDLATGIDLQAAGQRAWTLQLQITNLTNRTALYNFQSVFVGTRLVQPRTFAVRIKRHF
jgi:hypothetical protein